MRCLACGFKNRACFAVATKGRFVSKLPIAIGDTLWHILRARREQVVRKKRQRTVNPREHLRLAENTATILGDGSSSSSSLIVSVLISHQQFNTFLQDSDSEFLNSKLSEILLAHVQICFVPVINNINRRFLSEGQLSKLSAFLEPMSARDRQNGKLVTRHPNFAWNLSVILLPTRLRPRIPLEHPR